MKSNRRTWIELETLAREAWRNGTPWSRFWPVVSEDCRRLQAACPTSARPLYGRLLALVTAGDEDGIEPVGTFEVELCDCRRS
jgi:hypothetical protein